MQMRFGPNRVGPQGLLQSLVDGIKLGLKEGLVPAGVDKPIYLLAPIISVVPAFMAFAVIPMGPEVSVFGHQHPAAADRPAGGGALHPRRHLDRGVRHRAGRLGVGLHLSAARRAALVGAGDLLRDRDGVVVRRGVPLRGHDVHLGHRGRPGRHLVRVPAAAVVPGVPDRRWSAKPTARLSICPRPRANWSAASTPSTRR